jgi:hypothetical protein
MTKEDGSFRKCLARMMVRRAIQGAEAAYEQLGPILTRERNQRIHVMAHGGHGFG